VARRRRPRERRAAGLEPGHLSRIRPRPRRLLALLALLGAAACREPGRAAPGTLRVTILGEPDDPRIAPVREAIDHWNAELRRLGRRVQLDSGTVRAGSVPDEVLRAAGREVVLGRGPATRRLHAALSGVPGDVVVALSGTDLISFGVPWRAGGRGVVALRRSDIPPLSLPNTLRNVAAHELGHVLGLTHNADAATLMCGRPAPCRPAAFASDSARFFPLTPRDERRLLERWPRGAVAPGRGRASLGHAREHGTIPPGAAAPVPAGGARPSPGPRPPRPRLRGSRPAGTHRRGRRRCDLP